MINFDDLWMCLWCVELHESSARDPDEFFKKIWDEEIFLKQDKFHWEKNIRHWFLLTQKEIYEKCDIKMEEIRPCRLINKLGLDPASTLGPGDLTVDA